MVRGVQDGDALLALELVGVHRALVLETHASEPQQGVHQGGFAVVDVRDDGHVAGARQLNCWIREGSNAERGAEPTEEGGELRARKQPVQHHKINQGRNRPTVMP
jgi:hypothetical protein